MHKRSTGLDDVVRYAGFVQVAMGFFALLSVPVLASSFGWVGWMMSALAPSEPGYVLYSLGTATIAMLVMMPAAFCAGMTLPLFTTALLRQGASERAVGQIYAANTLGAIAGVLAAVHLLMLRGSTPRRRFTRMGPHPRSRSATPEIREPSSPMASPMRA